MQYSVPQFIDVENKIVGPISVRQFVIMSFGLALIFAFYKFADFTFFVFASIIIVFIVVVLAFVKVNGMPFHFFLLNLLQSMFNPKIRVWKKDLYLIDEKKKKSKKPNNKDKAHINYVEIVRKKRKARSRLSDLSLLVDTGGYFKRKF